MLWNIEPWQISWVLHTLGQIVAWCVVLYGLGRAMNWLVGKVPSGTDVTRGMRDVTNQWLNVQPPQKVRRRLYWKYVGLWFNNLPGAILLGLVAQTGRWWLLPLVAANWYWAGQEFGRQVALDQAQKWEDENASTI